jgi:hypothetical protein
MANQTQGSCYGRQQAQAERMGRPRVDAIGNSISNHPLFLTIEDAKTLLKNARFAEQPGLQTLQMNARFANWSG